MTYKEHFQKNFALAWPVMVTQAGQILVNVADNVMVGGLGGKYDYVDNPDLGKIALGAVSLGNSLFFMIMVTAFGFSFAMSPLIAQADARNNLKRGGAVLSHGLILNMIITVVLMVILIAVAPLMYRMDQPENVVDVAIPYLEIVTYSMLPLMVFQSFRQVSEGLSLTFVVTVATLIANLLNILFNYGFIFGYLGLPRMEVEGAALGTLLSRIIMVFTLLAAMWYHPKSKRYLKTLTFKNFQPVIFRKLIQLGIPTSLQMFFEVAAFAGAAFIVGMSGEVDLASHQIALNLASISFMLCTGLGIAATIRVGNQFGRKDYTTMKNAGYSTIAMVILFMFSCGLIIILFRQELPTLYIDNKEVIVLAAELLIIAALFQLSDGVQVVTLGALRGMQDVNIPTVITLFAYFVITLPLGYFLTVSQDMGAFGMWIALGIGLTISAVSLLLRYYFVTKRFLPS